ncbi:MAG: tRNA uridine-5-carboxymethylaminomethyl(34) synthesis GTPase MnmE [Planctomycetaceae bacterium]|nr:tRNA uridine-5-carboxymethylaminomethyl(34) synthesis GTPase MnmE [Planctomycetaceae bacterium]
MSVTIDETIAALASAPGSAERGIVRISGEVIEPLRRVFSASTDWAEARSARGTSGHVRLAGFDDPISARLHFWPTSRSYTGQPMAELHLPGAPPLLEAALSALYETGVRPARPGEFTLRAFLAGRVDLVQAEAVLGVIDAHEQQELEQALTQLAGGASGCIATVRGDLLDLLSELEAGLDFAEEEIEFVSREALVQRISQALERLNEIAGDASRRMVSAPQLRVVLAGLPNAGKSTLFNALLGNAQALVSSSEGTTRDSLHASIEWEGVALELIDTAGWEGDVAGIAEMAQEQRSERIAEGDVVLWCSACDLPDAERANNGERLRAAQAVASHVLPIATKADCRAQAGEGDVPTVSAQTGVGVDALRSTIAGLIRDARVGTRGLIGSTSARCHESLERGRESLERAIAEAEEGAGEELVAIELRDALEHLGRIVGAVYTDDILDRIFGRFCIGK